MLEASQPRILIVEDEEDIRELMVLHLRRDGYLTEEARDGEEAIEKIKLNHYDLFVMDWMLPGISGLEITRNLRKKNVLTSTNVPAPLLMVTARTEITDIVVGLEAGADDYITKPFDIPVFLARARALLRRSSYSTGSSAAVSEAFIRIGGLEIDPAAHQVRCAGKEIVLTPSEFRLLHTLAQNQGRVLTRDRLIEAVQGAGVTVVDRAIDTLMVGLRKKLGDYGDLVETIRGVGYRVKTAGTS